MAEKVGQKKADGKVKGKKEKKEKKVKPVFSIKTAKAMIPVLDEAGKPTKELVLGSAVNEKGLLIAVPVTIPGANEGDDPIQVGYDPAVFKPLKKDVFANIQTHLRFQAMMDNIRAEKLKNSAAVKLSKAEKLDKFGDEAIRRKAQRLQRMREQIKALEAQLVEDGADLEDIQD